MARTTRRRAKSRARRNPVVGPVIVILIGLTVFLYPLIATQWNNMRQARVTAEYSRLAEQASPEEKHVELDRANEYNAGLKTGPILDPWLARVSADNTAYQEYLKQLNRQEAMARIIIPKADVDLPVFHGTTADVLQRGAGHLFGSSLPVGGRSTHTVITGHSGLSNATMFDNLKKIRQGDPIYLVAAGQKLKYEVNRINVVLPTEPDDMSPVEGEDLLTLITCTPYGINSHRLLVHARRVPLDEVAEQEAFEEHGPPVQTWMWLVGAAGLLALGALLWWIIIMLRRQKRPPVVADDDNYWIPVTAGDA